MKREYAIIRQFDYSNKEEFETHKSEMEKEGYKLVKGMYSGIMDPCEIGEANDKWRYTASFIKSDIL